MHTSFKALVLFLFMTSLAWGQGAAPLMVEEADGSPKGSTTKLVVDNGTLTRTGTSMRFATSGVTALTAAATIDTGDVVVGSNNDRTVEKSDCGVSAGIMTCTGFTANGTGSGQLNLDEGSPKTTAAGEIGLTAVDNGSEPALVVRRESDGTNIFMTYKGEVNERRTVQMTVVDYTTNTTTGDGKAYFVVGNQLAGMNIVAVHARVITAGTTNTLNIDLRNVTQSNADILSTNLTIDSTETGSDTAAAAAVISTSEDDLTLWDLIAIDIDAIHTTPAAGLIVTIECENPGT